MKILIQIFIFIMVVYLGYISGMPWVQYYIFKKSVVERIESVEHKRVVETILNASEDLNVPVTKENITKDEYVNKIRYTITYNKTVEFPFGKTLDYEMVITKDKPLEDN